MPQVTIWHNPRCSKSRATLALLREHDCEVQEVRYLDDPPTAEQLRSVLEKLGCEPRSLIRTQESRYHELGLDDERDDEALIRAMVENPVLIERPVVQCGSRAAVGRPPENVLPLLESL